MIVSELSTQVNDLLRPMGITRNLSAYSILCQCLELVCEQEDRLQAVEKDIYTPMPPSSSILLFLVSVIRAPLYLSFSSFSRWS